MCHQRVSVKLDQVRSSAIGPLLPYRGNPLPELLSGQVQAFFGPIQSGIEYIRTGKLRALAVTTAARSEILPDVPVLTVCPKTSGGITKFSEHEAD